MPILGALANGGSSSYGMLRKGKPRQFVIDYLVVGGGGAGGTYDGGGGGAGGFLTGTSYLVTIGENYTIQVGSGGSPNLGGTGGGGRGGGGGGGGFEVIEVKNK